MNGKLTLEQLESFLDETCDSLRGDRDSVTFKEYVLAILFLKRLNDRFNKEREIRMQRLSSQGLSPEGIENNLEKKEAYRLFVPEIARWERLKQQNDDLSSYLMKAFAEIEENNPGCLGLLNTIDFKRTSLKGSPYITDIELVDLIKRFDFLQLADENLAF